MSVGATVMGAWARALPGDVNPDANEAQQWIRSELADPAYQDKRSFGQRLLDWLAGVFDGLQPDMPDPNALKVPSWVLVLGAAIVLGGIAFLVSRLRAEKAAADEHESRAVLGDLDLGADEFRDRGLAALRDGRWGVAIIELTRALARGAADRTLLTDAPSLTAHEIGAQLAPVFPEHEPPIRRTMDLFDAVRYGRYAASEADASIVRDTEATLRKAKPVLAAVGAELNEAWGVPR
jgi:hypothetical protein